MPSRIAASSLVARYGPALSNWAARSTTGRRACRRIRVPGPSLEGNLSGDDATRDVFVYLPPSYSRDSQRRYPVVVFLHGYTATADAYVRNPRPAARSGSAIAAGAREMIIVLPDSFTAYSGSMFSSSVTTGDWESYIARRFDRLRRRSLPHARAARKPRLGRAFDGRLWDRAHRYEAPRCVRRALCDELVLLADRSRARRRRRHARCTRARRGAGRVASSNRAGGPILRQASPTRCRRKRPLGRRIPTIRRSTSICRSRTASSIRGSRASGWRMRRCSWSTNTCRA